MVFVTGDTHGTRDFNKIPTALARYHGLSKDDYLIIAGDFGAIWDEGTAARDIAVYDNLPVTVLFVDGNHENFALLSKYPEEKRFGGTVQKIGESVFHLMRGEIYQLCGKSFFIFGGGTSADKDYRIAGLSWWQEEIPDHTEIANARRNLEKVGYRVNYIITHSCDEAALREIVLAGRTWKKDVYVDNVILTDFENSVSYDHWYFGHYHTDFDISRKKTALYHDVRLIAE